MRKVLSTKDASEYLGISVRTLEKWRQSLIPKGPKWIDMDGIIKYLSTDLDDYIDSNVKESGAA